MLAIVVLVGARRAIQALVGRRRCDLRRRSRRCSPSPRAGSAPRARIRSAIPSSRADVARLERTEHVSGTPVSVEDVSQWTNQANAFTEGFGPSAHVVLWNTLLDGRFSRGEEDVVIAHELGHVREPPHHQGHRLDRAASSCRRSGCPRWRSRPRGGLGKPGEPAVRLPRADRDRAAGGAAGERRLAAVRGRGRLAGAAGDERPGFDEAALPELPADESRGTEPGLLLATSGSRTIRR